MSPVVIVLIIIGLVFIFTSFVITAKLEEEGKEGVVEIPDELSDDQKEKIDKLINDYMDEHADGRLTDILRKGRFSALSL